MKKLSTYLTETEQVNEAITKEGAITAAIILAASFCVPNVVGLIYQLGKYGFNMINRKKLLQELPDITMKEKEEIVQLIKDHDWNDGTAFSDAIRKIETAETPEEIMSAIEEFRKATDDVWYPGLGNIGTKNWDNIRKKTEKIHKANQEYTEKTDKKLHLRWTISPLSWLGFVAGCLGSGSHHSHRSSRGGRFGGFGGGKFGGGGANGSW